MDWKRCPPKPWNYETKEEYEDALDRFNDALEEDYEARRLNRED